MIRHLLHSAWIMVVGVGVLIALGTVLARRAPEFVAVKQEIKYIQGNVNQVRQEQEELERKQSYYRSEAYLEQQARIQLNYRKPGEQVVYIYRTASEPQETKPEEPLTNLKLWWYYFLGRF